MVYIQILMHTVWNETYVRLLVREGKEMKKPLTPTDDGYDSYISGCNSGEFYTLLYVNWDSHTGLNIKFCQINARALDLVV